MTKGGAYITYGPRTIPKPARKKKPDIPNLKKYGHKGWYTAGGPGSGFPYRGGTCPHCNRGVREGDVVYAFQIDLGLTIPQKKVVVQHRDCIMALAAGNAPPTTAEKLKKKWEEGGRFLE